MTTIGRQYKPQRSFINGVDNTTPLESTEIANTLSECLNGEMVDDNIVKTRNGFTGITAVKTGYIIREGIEYVKQDGTRENIVYLESTTLTGNSAILGRVNGTAIDTITSGLPDGIKPCMLQARTQLFVFTGVEDFIYDGTTTKQIGIDAPTVKPQVFSTTITGSLNVSGHYLFIYTYYNSITGAESSPSLPSASITAGANGGIKIQVTPGSATTADQIKVYRTVSGGGVFFLDGTVPITSTTYSSTVTDAGLGNELELDNERLPEAAKFAVLVDNRIFVGGFPSNKNRVQYSKIGINGPMYESFQVADFTDCNPNDNDEILGLGKIGSKVGIVKQRKAGKLIIMDSSLGGLERSGYQKYVYKEMTDTCTGTNHHSIFNLKDTMGWLGKDNVYLSDGINIIPIGNRVRKTIRSLNHNQAYKYSSINVTDNQQIIISVVRAGQLEPDYQLVGHYINYPIIGWTMFSPGVDPTTHPGIPMSCAWNTTVNDMYVPYFGSSNSNGKVYQLGLGTNDDSYPIYFSVKGQWECGADAMGLKAFQSVKYLATTSAVSPNNVLTNTWEENGKEYVVKTQGSTIASVTKWGTAKWATFKWAGLTYTLAKFFPNRKSNIARFGLLNDDLDAQFAIKSMRLLYRNISE